MEARASFNSVSFTLVPPKSAAEALDGDMHESEVLDYKATIPGAELAKRIAAMANAFGGLIILGVGEIDGLGTPEKPVKGLSNPDDVEREIAEQLRARLFPSPTRVQRVQYDGKHLIEIHVSREFCTRWDRDQPHYDLRVGSGTQPMKRAEIEAALRRDLGTKEICTISPVSIHTSTTETSVNLRLTIINDSPQPITATNLTMRISANGKEENLLPLGLYEDTEIGWTSKPGSILPIAVQPRDSVIRRITAKSGPISGKPELIALSGTVTIANTKLPIRQIFANAINPIPHPGDFAGFNLIEIEAQGVVLPLAVPESPSPKLPLLVPELHPQAVEERLAGAVTFGVTVFLRNTGEVSAKEVRVRIEHTDNNVVQYAHSGEWENQPGSATLNPREIRSVSSIHTGELRGTYLIQFRDEPPENIVFRVQIWCLDQPSTKWRLEIPRERLRTLRGISFPREQDH
jgi:hypothetical protein